MIKSKSLAYLPPPEAICECGAHMVWYRNQCTDCIQKHVKISINRHRRNKLQSLELTNYEIARVRVWS